MNLLRRRHYEREGIEFVGRGGPLRAERLVSKVLRNRQTRDHLIEAAEPADFIATWRGFRVQLYAASPSAIDAVTRPALAGTYIDRDTPAQFSIGQLTPNAITFASAKSHNFTQRKRNILLAAENAAWADISEKSIPPLDLPALQQVDLGPYITNWCIATMREIVWGNEITRELGEARFNDSSPLRGLPFENALLETFVSLRTRSRGFRERILPWTAPVRLSRTSRRIGRDIRCLNAWSADVTMRSSPQSIASMLVRLNAECDVPCDDTRDDVVTCFLAGVDTLNTAVHAVVWALLHSNNERWRAEISQGGSIERDNKILRACILEALRINTPGSVFSGCVMQDFEIETKRRTYRIRKGTLIAPSIHSLHNIGGTSYDPSRFMSNGVKAADIAMPFGRGVRSCPGKNLAMNLMMQFASTFFHENTDILLADQSQPASFNTDFREPLWIIRKEVCNGQ